jgi:hypothetical protein
MRDVRVVVMVVTGERKGVCMTMDFVIPDSCLLAGGVTGMCDVYDEVACFALWW